jgi:SAM-dependent methyltransferase
VAKTRQRSFTYLPLSDAFYARLSHTSARLGFAARGEDDLAQAVSDLSRVYTRERSTIDQGAKDRPAHAARAQFFLPRDLVKVLGPVADLARLGRIPAGPTLRVLDVGAGLGATSFGLSRALKLSAPHVQKLEVLAVERDARALSFFSALAGDVSTLADEFVPLRVTAQALDVTRSLPDGRFDVVLLGFVLNELFAERPDADQVALRSELLMRLSEKLAPGGVIVALEPALKATTRLLMAVRDTLVARARAPYVLAPCLRTGPCPMLPSERDWCHEELAFALPAPLARVARAAGLRFEGLSYAALVLGDKPRAQPTGMRVVSERLESKGKLELFGCGEAGLVRLSLLNRDESELNRAFADARRGHELVVEGDGARIGKETRVTRT